MKTKVDNRLFWFLKEDTELDLSNKAQLDLFVQQTLSRGRVADVKRLFRIVERRDVIESVNRLNKFLPKEVRKFWEEWLGDLDKSAKEDTHPLR
jgi:hypothetical protein